MERRSTRHGGERGLVLPLVGIVLATLITFASIALDLGYQRVQRRDMQAVADLVALDLSRMLDGSTANALRTPIQSAASVSSTRNDHAVAAADVNVVFGGAADTCKDGGNIVTRCLTVELGSVDAARVFTPLPGPCNASTASTCVPSAVRVWAGSDVEYFFRPGSGDTRRSAVAGNQPKAQFEVGAWLANAGGVQGSLIDQLFDNALGVNVLSPNGLVNSRIGLGELQTAIGLLMPGAGANTQLSARDYLLLAAKAAELGGDTANATLLNGAAALANQTSTQLTMGELSQMYLQGGSAVLDGSINLFGYIQSGVALMDGSQVLSLSGAGINLPGLANPTATVSVVQPSSMSAFGPIGIEAANQQLGIAIRPNLSTTGSGNVNSCDVQSLGTLIGGLLSCILGIGGIVLGNAVLPVSVTIGSGNSVIQVTGARAVGRLTGIDCAANPSITVTPVSFTPLAVSANLSFTGTVVVGNLNRSVTVTQPLSFALGGSASAQTFLDPSQFNQPRTVGSTNVGLANSVTIGAPTVTIDGSGLAGAALTTLNTVIGPVVQTAVSAALNPTLNLFDDLLSAVATQIGINVGGADITAHLRECLTPELVG
jgi:uncharacterized membrane protein